MKKIIMTISITIVALGLFFLSPSKEIETNYSHAHQERMRPSVKAELSHSASQTAQDKVAALPQHIQEDDHHHNHQPGEICLSEKIGRGPSEVEESQLSADLARLEDYPAEKEVQQEYAKDLYQDNGLELIEYNP